MNRIYVAIKGFRLGIQGGSILQSNLVNVVGLSISQNFAVAVSSQYVVTFGSLEGSHDIVGMQIANHTCRWNGYNVDACV